MSGFTDTVMMIRPKSFGFNEETAANNVFQKQSELSSSEVSKKAVEEFDAFVDILRSNGIEVLVMEDTLEPRKPDAIFPNNWISLHADGALITYPMFAENRRIERREDIIEQLENKFGYNTRYCFEMYEAQGLYLEGTGSMVLDRENKICYACMGPRSEVRLMDKFCLLKGYRLVKFYARDKAGQDIYHTNVMMAIGHDYVVLCEDSIVNDEHKDKILASLKESGKKIVKISFEQMNSFAGNMLELKNKNGDHILVTSKQAFESLNKKQVEMLQRRIKFVSSDITTIETLGGGSARCMLAEIFYPKA